MKYIIMIVSLCCFTVLSAQNSAKEPMSSSKEVNKKAERNSIRGGNKLYSDEKYTESEIEYRKALDANPDSWMGMYNLGNSLFRQGKYEAAFEQYKKAATLETDSIKSAQAWYNMGNVFMQDKKYAESIDAYKNALRRNPKDDEARYNLRLAQLLLKKQQQDQKNQDQNKNQNKDNKDQKTKIKIIRTKIKINSKILKTINRIRKTRINNNHLLLKCLKKMHNRYWMLCSKMNGILKKKSVKL